MPELIDITLIDKMVGQKVLAISKDTGERRVLEIKGGNYISGIQLRGREEIVWNLSNPIKGVDFYKM